MCLSYVDFAVIVAVKELKNASSSSSNTVIKNISSQVINIS